MFNIFVDHPYCSTAAQKINMLQVQPISTLPVQHTAAVAVTGQDGGGSPLEHLLQDKLQGFRSHEL